MSQQLTARSSLECPVCHRIFSKVSALAVHRSFERKRLANPELIVCRICKLVFTGREYADHKLICKAVPRVKVITQKKYHYECNVCGEKFSASLEFRKHENQHLPRNQYIVHLSDDTIELKQLN